MEVERSIPIESIKQSTGHDAGAAGVVTLLDVRRWLSRPVLVEEFGEVRRFVFVHAWPFGISLGRPSDQHTYTYPNPRTTVRRRLDPRRRPRARRGQGCLHAPAPTNADRGGFLQSKSRHGGACMRALNGWMELCICVDRRPINTYILIQTTGAAGAPGQGAAAAPAGGQWAAPARADGGCWATVPIRIILNRHHVTSTPPKI